jgi:hypothetical protein
MRATAAAEKVDCVSRREREREEEEVDGWMWRGNKKEDTEKRLLDQGIGETSER